MYLESFEGVETGSASVQKMALTATATKSVRMEIKSALGLDRPFEMVRNAVRKNLLLETCRVSKVPQIHDQIARRLANMEPGTRGIIYCPTRRSTRDLSAFLKSQGVSVESYHGGMDSEKRRRVYRQFIDQNLSVVVATSAFGMGVDIADLRFVYHAGLPQSIEQYVQELSLIHI